MNKRILIVDDNSNDRYMLEVLFKGYGYDITSAENGADALLLARKEPPDAIISDIMMPVRDGFSLCREWKLDEKLKTIPFIFYTATYTTHKDEKFAMNLGAKMFLRKPQEPEVLVEKLRQILEENDEKKSGMFEFPLGKEMEFFRDYNKLLFHKLETKMAELKTEKEFLKSIFESLTHPFYVIDASNQVILMANPAACKNHLRTGSKCFEITHQRNTKCSGEDICPLEEVKKTKKPVTVEHIHHDKDGNPGNFEVHGYPIFDKEGKVVQMIEYSLDITQRKRAEKELNLLASIVKNIPDSVCTIGLDKNIITWNEGSERMLGYKKEEILGKPITIVIPEDLASKELDHCLSILNAEGFFTGYESLRITKDGKIIPVEITAVVLKDEKCNITGYTSIIRDITERKKANEHINFLKHSLDMHSDGAYWIDSNNNFVYINDAGCKALGYSNEELIGKSIGYVNPLATPERMKNLWEMLRKKNSFLKESLHRRKDGSEFPVEIVSTFVRFDNKEFCCGFARDITERKKAELEYKTILKTAMDGFYVTDLQGHILDVNDSYCSLTGYSREELLKKTLIDIDVLDTEEIISQRIERIIKVGWERFETSHKCKDGRIVELEASVNYSEAGGGKFFVFIRDITEKKLAEKALRESESMLNDAQQLAKIGSWSWNVETDVVRWSKELYEMIGQNPQLPPPTYANHASLYTKESWEILSQAVQRAVSKGMPYELELDMVRTDGGKFCTNTRGRAIKDESGRVVLLTGMVQDITERKTAELLLEESRKRYQALFEQAGDGIVMHDTNGKILSVNETFAHMHGLSIEEITQKGLDNLDVEGLKKIPERMPRIIAGETLSFEVEHYHKDGHIFPLLVTANLISTGNERFIISIHRDLTERKRDEMTLRLQGEIMKNMTEGVYLIRLSDGKIVYANPKFENMFGYNPGELIGKEVSIVKAPTEKTPEETTNEIVNILKESGEWHGEVKNITKYGTHFYCYANVSIFDHPEYGRVILSVLTDITERKQTEEELMKVKLGIERSDEVIFITNIDGTIIFVNPAFEKIYGYSREEALGKTPRILKSGLLPSETYKPFWDTLLEKKVVKGELVNKTKDGRLLNIDGSANPILNNDGVIVGFLAIQRDITERKQVDDKIKASLEEKEVLLREIHHRVKNNMQIISSLLNLQMGYVNDKNIKNIFSESQNRILSMALVHEKLYLSSDLRNIDFKEYINNLGVNLLQSYNANNIQLNVNVETISLDIDLAVPVGLIINELITNSLKYAFPGGMKGQINILFRSIGEDMLELVVSDNGIGLPEDLDIRNTKTLGLHLVTSLSEMQLHGKVDLDRTSGTSFQIRFKGIK